MLAAALCVSSEVNRSAWSLASGSIAASFSSVVDLIDEDSGDCCVGSSIAVCTAATDVSVFGAAVCCDAAASSLLSAAGWLGVAATSSPRFLGSLPALTGDVVDILGIPAASLGTGAESATSALAALSAALASDLTSA